MWVRMRWCGSKSESTTNLTVAIKVFKQALRGDCKATVDVLNITIDKMHAGRPSGTMKAAPYRSAVVCKPEHGFDKLGFISGAIDVTRYCD